MEPLGTLECWPLAPYRPLEAGRVGDGGKGEVGKRGGPRHLPPIRDVE